jgi:hypothetical protein
MSVDALRYHGVRPENKKDDYFEFDTVDFLMSAQGRKFNGGSVRVVGEVEVVYPTTAGSPDPLAVDVAYDGPTGAHSWFDRVDTSFAQVGSIENIGDYPRYVAAKAQASLAKDDLFNSVYTCENRVPTDVMANLMLKGMVDISKAGVATFADASGFVKPLDFSVKLDCCLNNMIGDTQLPYAKTGDIKVSLTLARNVNVLYGNSNIGGSVYYKLKNLMLVYTSVPDNAVYAPQYNFKVSTNIKQSIQSSYASISTKVPIVASSAFLTFILQANENNALKNGMCGEELPLVAEVQFIFNDAMNQEFTYTLDNREEILYNYIKAVSGVVGTNNASLNTLASNQGYGMGINFGTLLDLSKSKLGININSGVSSGAPYVAYMFFSGLLSL